MQPLATNWRSDTACKKKFIFNRARKYVDSAIRWRNFLTVRWVVPSCVITMENIVNILGGFNPKKPGQEEIVV